MLRSRVRKRGKNRIEKETGDFRPVWRGQGKARGKENYSTDTK